MQEKIMSGFQRFVTYMNLYEENSKIRNVGFAKIEKRGKSCSVEIHMKGIGYTGISCPVHLFVRKEKKLLGISIGEIKLQNGTGDYRVVLESDNLNQSGYDLEQVSGLMIFVTEKTMFASQWDELEIKREQFSAFEPNKEKENKQPKEAEKEMNPRTDSKVEEKKAAEPKKAGGIEEPKKADRTIEPKKAARMEESKKTTEIKKTEEVGPAEKAEITEKEDPEKDTIKATEAAVATKVIPMEHSWLQKWQFIKENYPVMTPFEGEDQIMCVRIELKDLRLLPKRYWYLGNNSFLLHGFFNYRYLILGNIEENGKNKWFIGVPGIFQSQEKVMASIFGFPEYKSEKKSRQKTGQFGYWYRFMDE